MDAAVRYRRPFGGGHSRSFLGDEALFSLDLAGLIYLWAPLFILVINM
jgi:hypothetical protein